MDAIEGYRKRTGAYPEKVLADTIYRNKKNRKFCEAHGIRMSGPKLGRPSSDAGKKKEQKKIEQQDMTDRIEVELRFSRAKRCFGLGGSWKKQRKRLVVLSASECFLIILFQLVFRALSKIGVGNKGDSAPFFTFFYPCTIIYGEINL